MTVAELIEQLKTQDPDAVVLVEYGDGYWEAESAAEAGTDWGPNAVKIII